MAEIELKQVSFCYPGVKKPALDDINLTIHSSEFIVLCGKSGCGKSTLLRQMKKNLMPFGDLKGQILYHGIDITELDDRRSAQEIGFVQQNPENQIVTDKVWHEMAFGLESLGYPNQVIRRKVAEMASFFGIQSWFRKNICDLSGGQKQLLNLASIMAMQPKILILDEPTSQLDPIASMEFLETLQRINRELGTTIIISEHRLEELFPMADKAIVMENGKVLAYDETEAVAAYLGEHNNVMYQGMPTAMKIYAGVKAGGKCPVTVRDGRIWLNQLFPNGVTVSRKANPQEEKTPARKIGKGLFQKEQKQENDTAEVVLEDVWFRYQRNGADIVRGISMQVKKGEFFCMVGGNGVGKSTTLKLISGVYKPYRGRITICGKDAQKIGRDDVVVGTLPQNPQSLFTEITVKEELLEALYYDKRSFEEKEQEVEKMLASLMLDHLSQSHPYDLSGGEQQRLALGKVLLLNPEILLLDEPTKGLDPYIKTVFADILSRLKKSGVTIIMVTHDIEFAAEYADRCAMVFDGDIVSCDTAREFFSGNSFYTTASNRMSRNLFEDAITCQDVIDLCAANLIRKDT